MKHASNDEACKSKIAKMEQKTVDLRVEFCGVEFVNPLVLASGVLGTEAELMARVVRVNTGNPGVKYPGVESENIGAVTTKSCSMSPRLGHENPTVLAWQGGLLNAVGLTNPGVIEEIKEIKKLKKLLIGKKTKIIASFFGGTKEEFVKVAQELVKAQPDFLEMNISCPNVESEHGRMFAADKSETFGVVKAVKNVVGKMPLVVKISPNVTDIVEIGKAAEDAGADGVCAINTLLGMVIDVESGKPVLTNKIGGVSGVSIRPVAVRCVWQLSKALRIPVIGLGGVSSGRDVLEMVMAGASLVGIGSAVYDRGLEVFSDVTREVKEMMAENGFTSLDEIRGRAHE